VGFKLILLRKAEHEIMSIGTNIQTMGDLENYVKGGERKMQDGTVLLDVTHNYLKNQYIEIPFDVNWTISYVKERVYTMHGTAIAHMKLTLNGFPLDNDNETLYSYGAKTGMVLHVTDTDPYSGAKNGGYENVNLVKKYVMTDEDYEKRDNTYRAYKKKMLAKDPNWKPVHLKNGDGSAYKVEEAEENKETLEEANERIKVGNRCQAIGGRRGEVCFIGLVPEIKGMNPEQVWVGVKYDEPVGKNDGTINGKRYFTADANHGGFVKSRLVEVGDFPEEDPFASDNDDEDVMEEL